MSIRSMIQQMDEHPEDPITKIIEAKLYNIVEHIVHQNKEYEEEHKLIQKKYLLQALKRYKQYDDEYKSLLQDMQNYQLFSLEKEDIYEDKLKPIEIEQQLTEELKQKELEKQNKINLERRRNLEIINNQINNILEEISQLAKDNSQFVDLIQQCFDHLYSLFSKAQSFVDQNVISNELIESATKFRDEAQAAKISLFKLIEEKRKELIFQQNVIQSVHENEIQIEAEPSKETNEVELEPVIESLDIPNVNKPTDNNIHDHDQANIKDFTETVSFRAYLSNQEFLQDFEKSVNEFTSDKKFKSYKNDLQIFIKTLVNTISNGTDVLIRQKIIQLKQLFDKKTISFQGKNISANNHPDAIKFCYLIAAKTFISVGAKQVAHIPKSAHSMGVIISAISAQFPEFERIFTSLLQEKCPFIVPYYPKDADEMEYLIACGYTLTKDGKSLESDEAFINRTKALIMIYAVVLQSDMWNRTRDAWRWLACFINMNPRPLISAAVLHAFLLITSFKLEKIYKKQFAKLIIFIRDEFIPMVEKASKELTKKQSLVQLELFIDECCKYLNNNSGLPKPDGYISKIVL